MAPVAGGVPDGQQNRNVTAYRFGEGLRTPLVPIDGILLVLQEIRARGVGQTVGHVADATASPTALNGRTRGSPQWRTLAAQLSLEENDVLNRIHQLATDLPTAMAVAAEADPVRELNTALPERLTDLVTSRCRVLMAIVD